MAGTKEKIEENLSRAAGYLSRVETRTRADRDRLVFAQDQVMAVLDSLRGDVPVSIEEAIVEPPIEEIADMIADWFGRSVIDADRDLAAQIITRLTSPDKQPAYRDPAYGWHRDELA